MTEGRPKRGEEAKIDHLLHEDPHYYDFQPPTEQSTLDAAVDRLIGRGRCGRVMPARRAQ